MSKAEDFVSRVLFDRDLAHIQHWKTRNKAEHEALGEFYEKITSLIDKFVEQYQGTYDMRMDISRSDESPDDTDIREEIGDGVEWIEAYRYQICEKEETSLQNVIDEIVGEYQHTKFMLTLE